MHSLEEKDSSPLEDAEITRLINVSKELGYKKQDKIPERNLVDFKPTPIMQIATSSSQKDQTKYTSNANQSPEMKQPENESEIKESLGDSFLKEANDPISSEIETNMYDSSKQNEDVASLEGSSKTSSDIPDVSAQLDNLNEEESTKSLEPKVDDKEDISAETISNEKPNIISGESDATNVEDAKKEGIEIGKNIALTELENEQQRIIETFQLIIQNIKDKESVDKTDLTQSILKTITRLASERSGCIIEDNPEPFKNKIITFVEKIEEASKKLILNLNPRDANLIEKSLVKSLNHKEIEIRESPELFRGDFILQMGSVEIGDLISEQISISEGNDESTVESAKTPVDSEKASDKKIATDAVTTMNESKNKKGSKGDENGK